VIAVSVSVEREGVGKWRRGKRRKREEGEDGGYRV
jgi:hypothetical protein